MPLTAAQKIFFKRKENLEIATIELELRRQKLAKTCKHQHELHEYWLVGGMDVGWRCKLCYKYSPWSNGQWYDFDQAHDEVVRLCKHPSSAVSTYQWEHDNGYGRQSMVDAERCNICRSEKHWKGMGGWMSRAEQQRQDALHRSDDF